MNSRPARTSSPSAPLSPESIRRALSLPDDNDSSTLAAALEACDTPADRDRMRRWHRALNS